MKIIIQKGLIGLLGLGLVTGIFAQDSLPRDFIQKGNGEDARIEYADPGYWILFYLKAEQEKKRAFEGQKEGEPEAIRLFREYTSIFKNAGFKFDYDSNTWASKTSQISQENVQKIKRLREQVMKFIKNSEGYSMSDIENFKGGESYINRD